MQDILPVKRGTLRMSLFEKYRLKKVINASGTMTSIGASRVSNRVINAMSEILPEFVEIRELQRAAGVCISKATGAGAGCLTASAAAGISVAVAACMTGSDLYKIEKLPDTEGMKNEVILQKGHSVNFGANIAQMIRLTGAKCIEIGTATQCGGYQFRGAISPNTAAAVYVVSHHTVQGGMIRLEEFIQIAREHNIPVIVDAASEYDLRGFIAAGADIVIYSGHKFLGGPTSGIIAGREDIVKACYCQENGIARGMKIGKESIVGAMEAIGQWLERDAALIRQEEDNRIEYAYQYLKKIKGLSVEYSPDPTNNPITRLKVLVNQGESPLTAVEICDALSGGNPSIKVRAHTADQGYFSLDPCNLLDGEIQVVCRRIWEIMGNLVNKEFLTENMADPNMLSQLRWPGNDKQTYLELNHSIEKRVADLLNRMTLEEKLREMNMLGSVGSIIKDGVFSPELAQQFFKGMGIGAVQDPRLDPEDTAEVVNELQRFLIENTRLGIPAFIIAETLHGVMSPGMTVFPQAIALASTWDTELIKEIASVIAKEARSIGISQSLAPDLDLAREPRWGRVEETYGEDPYLCARFGVEYIKGLQGDGLVMDNDHIVATIKHFAAHGSPEGGVNLSPVPVGERQLRELYLPPFKAGIAEAGALCVMPAYSEFDGIPCSSSKTLLNGILREEWGFKGYTISDYCAIDMLVYMHHTAVSYDQAAKQALEAGMDMEAPNINAFGEGLKMLVKNRQLPEELIDRAVSRILRVKISAGLFENPYIDTKKIKSTVNCDTHKKLALKAAQESIVLLKNKDNLLPLDKNIESIAVIGPNADVAQLGDYCLEKEDAVSLLQGITSRIASKTRLSFAKGCGIYELSKDRFDEAIEAARNAKAAIIAVGGSSMMDYGMGWGQDSGNIKTCGEGFDVTDLGLPGVQQQLVEAVISTGTPTIVVLMDGRPSSIPWIAENASAVIEAWYAGEEGGNALADIIFGNVNPSGRLTVSFPKTVGQTPVYYNYKPSARGFYKKPGSPESPGRDYVFMDTKPLFEFGFGLNYTEFEYSDLKIWPEKIGCDGKTAVSVKVRNIGKREGKEVVQLYVNDVVSSVTTPVKALKGFMKINLKPGEEKEVAFELGFEELSLLNEQMVPVIEPGEFEVIVGNLSARFEVE
ncbi:MAG: aminotransferase class V-fold PLP-dependent enzyme [Ruminiclostridium sp.]|nr:aminotransferase class V-fold PLP-dependent enzyme [Ruminiclostridium sp.]